MNYLAHAFLSNGDKDLLVGNFIADHIRGNQLQSFPEPIIKGIHLHRRIDTFTDEHPEFRKSKRIFYDGLEKHSGIPVNIYFHQLLAPSFQKYSKLRRDDFSHDVYSVYTPQQHLLPARSSRFLDYGIKNNNYTAYSSQKG